ncbi:MAG: TIGR01906 family membrane protein [Clostridiales Family XIII bacterium]|jgi:integral membrane protein (TIGR01906 family)|nr:TIGR01906 family membrane protein [Clostridiales Family XIII bacterium]
MKTSNAPNLKKEKYFSAPNICAALFLALFILSFSVVFTLFFRPLYAYDIGALDIPARSGLPEAEVRANYDALIDYNSVFARGDLEFPTLPMSESGRIHFGEVKRIFSAFQILLLLSAAGAALLCARQLRRGRAKFLKLGGIAAACIPLLLGAVTAAAGWERAFVLFHKLFFNNNFWLFDSAADPVILILPDAFFLHCLIMILSLLAGLSAASILAGAALTRKK